MDDNGVEVDRELVRVRRHMREMRREKGYADRVDLTWVLAHRPERYEQVRHWFCRTGTANLSTVRTMTPALSWTWPGTAMPSQPC